MQAAQCSGLWCNGAQPLQKNVVVGQAIDEDPSHRLLSHCQLISSERNFSIANTTILIARRQTMVLRGFALVRWIKHSK